VSGTAGTFSLPSLAENVMNQRIASTLGYIGSVAAAVLAAGLTSGNALAAGASEVTPAQLVGPFEGGQAANTFAMSPRIASTADRATVSAEGRDAARHLDSRSGYQSDYQTGTQAPYTSTRSRDEVRAEAVAALRESGTQVFEGGQSGTVVTRVARRPATTIAGDAATAAH
jgi:hypothetical protein